MFWQEMMLLGYLRQDVPHFVGQGCSPAAVLAVVEALVAERQLRRIQANRLEAYVLAKIDAHGCWQGNPWHGEVRESVLAPDVVRLADIGTP